MSTSSDLVKMSASSCCWAVGSVTPSSPACMATMTMSAPAARASAARFSRVSGSRSGTRYGNSTGMPLVPYVPATTAIFTPSAVSWMRGSSNSSCVRAMPACSSPASSMMSRVRISPSVPASTEWFDAVVHMSQPAFTTSPAIGGGAWKLG